MSTDVLEILRAPEMTKICAPMVRYSKLPFRSLVRRYNCDICFTPMILANSFVQSAEARENEFTTNSEDKPLIVQFAAKDPIDFADATELVAPYCNGVDLNCGCPQRWAMHDGYGASLLEKPELVKDLVRQVKNRISAPFTVSVKIRLLKDIKKSIQFCQILEHAGVSFLTVHARTPQMRKEPIDLEGLKLVRDCVKIPIIANGNVKSLREAEHLYEESKCQGVMVANGLLKNPALFTGTSVTPISCVQDWLNITSIIPTNFLTFHHHLIFMLEKVLPYDERMLFNCLKEDKAQNFIESYYGIKPQYSPELEDSLRPTTCDYTAFFQMKHQKPKNNILMSGDNDDKTQITVAC
ncbi:tRNA-dihydrouridine(20a/20b) synthase [NAD(P)+]-like [Chelonus insularis]|uniref:tRNA-dihydrouridine(20a/20b) synthase [NAD(P)+]-like n=1 Tax=Chelonus insularis TaxID=460826 RepID=UPI00158D827A|nr:tRNA-dihydrouridine(20a/20b) synthase [NAD(P)+]-like [Chelonus insularis]